MMTDENASTTTESLTRVAAKLPGFWTNDPPLWFGHTETTFRSSNITDSRSKFDLVIQKLPQEVLSTVRDLVLGSGGESTTPYEDIKKKLLAAYSLTKWQRVTKIIHHPAIGDMRPSTLMGAMKGLLPDKEEPGLLFQGLFLERLPIEMRDHLVSHDFKTVDEMAHHADKLWDARRAAPSEARSFPLTEYASSNTDAQSESNLAVLQRAPTRERARSPNQHTQTRDQTPGRIRLCFYHFRFGKKARTCESPCSWTGNGQAGGRFRRN